MSVMAIVMNDVDDVEYAVFCLYIFGAAQISRNVLVFVEYYCEDDGDGEDDDEEDDGDEFSCFHIVSAQHELSKRGLRL